MLLEIMEISTTGMDYEHGERTKNDLRTLSLCTGVHRLKALIS